MKNFFRYKTVIQASLISSFFSTQLCFADIDTNNVGEQAMIRSLRKTLESKNCLTTKKINIGAGETGSEAFKAPASSDELNVLLTWQWLESMKDLADDTVVVAPRHAVDHHFKQIKNKVELYTIDGVLHTQTLESIHRETASMIDDQTRVIVMLGGDTHQLDRSITRYTSTMASELIGTFPADQKVLILNGPRTGKYITSEGQLTVDPDAHRSKTDHVTQEVHKFSENRPWTVVDFIYGQKSLWAPALKFCLDHPDTILILPGESTSMISEALAMGIHPLIYIHDAMTETSVRYVKQLVLENKASQYNGSLTSVVKRQTPIEPQENPVAEYLCASKR